MMERGVWSAKSRPILQGRTDTDINLVLAGILLEVLSNT
jgi:hypothetical protein